MNVIFLSGGSGKRLWPLSNEVRSKQFLKIFKLPDGSYESMVQRMYRMLISISPESSVTFATSENQVSSIRAQLGEDVGISVEPCRRDTFPAIVLASAYLHEMKNINLDEPVIVCPVDAFVEDDYFQALKQLDKMVKNGSRHIALMGIEPTYPSEKYGYIIPEKKDELGHIALSDKIERVASFKEKPSTEQAKAYIDQGALWNGGIFAFKLSYILNKAQKLFGTCNYRWLFEKYETLPKISFDYAVVENESDIAVLCFSGQWKDIGTWNTMTEAMSDLVSGNALIDKCSNTHVINELQIPLIALGCHNMAIAATPDGILVTDKEVSTKLKSYVTDARPMYEERPWGDYQVLDYRRSDDGQNSLTKHLVIKAGKHISYQIHRYRSEYWTITDGEGIVILDGVEYEISRGSTAYIKPGMKHAVKAGKIDLHIIEVQMGNELTEEDIERLDFDWDSVMV